MTQPDNPICGWCNRPRLSDIDPSTTVFLCPQHQQIADRIHADVEKILVPIGQLAPPAGYDRWPAGIITSSPEPAEENPFSLDDMIAWIRRWQQNDRHCDGVLEAQIAMEIQVSVMPVSPIELAIRIATIARRYFHNRLIASTHTGWRVVWLSETAGVVLTEECVRPHQAEQLGASRVGTNGIAGYKIERCEHEAYDDGSHFTGPWITVTNTLAPTTEETPCPAKNSD